MREAEVADYTSGAAQILALFAEDSAAEPTRWKPKHGEGSVSQVEMVTPVALIYKVLFPSISTFETPPNHDRLTRPHTKGILFSARLY